MCTLNIRLLDLRDKEYREGRHCKFCRIILPDAESKTEAVQQSFHEEQHQATTNRFQAHILLRQELKI